MAAGASQDAGSDASTSDDEEPPRAQETFAIKGAKIESLRAAFDKRGWMLDEEASGNEPLDDTSDNKFNFLWTIKARHVEQLLVTGAARKRQIFNHFERAWALITKHRLAELNDSVHRTKEKLEAGHAVRRAHRGR